MNGALFASRRARIVLALAFGGIVPPTAWHYMSGQETLPIWLWQAALHCWRLWRIGGI